MSNKEQELLDAAMSAYKEMERWQRIATMMSHFITCDIRSAECKFCKTAFEVYAEAKEEHAALDAAALEYVIDAGYLE